MSRSRDRVTAGCQEAAPESKRLDIKALQPGGLQIALPLRTTHPSPAQPALDVSQRAAFLLIALEALLRGHILHAVHAGRSCICSSAAVP
jgi:hypothetical protein